MRNAARKSVSLTCNIVKCAFICFTLVLAWSSNSIGAIIWSGDFETGDFLQYHQPGLPDVPWYWAFPQYCWPTQPRRDNKGDGSCGSIVTSPVRQGSYAAKLTVKNSANGLEPQDCDGASCDRRRSELAMQATIPIHYNGMPYMAERWMSVSIFIPADWENISRYWGTSMFSIKPGYEPSGSCGVFLLGIDGDTWSIRHWWSDIVNASCTQIPWQQNPTYDKNRPSASEWSDLRTDFPNESASRAALGDLNKGGWTDWVLHFKSDARGSQSGGTGFLVVWKRAGAGEWLKVLDVRPRIVTEGGMTYDRGIFHPAPPDPNASPTTARYHGGFGPKFGMYMPKEQAWNLSGNRVIYLDNIKIGDETSSFHEMTPEGRIESNLVPPSPPPLFRRTQ